MQEVRKYILVAKSANRRTVPYSSLVLWTGPFPVHWASDHFIIITMFCSVEIPVFNSNSVDSDQTLRSAASELDLHCLPMSLLWDARYKLVNIVYLISVALAFCCLPDLQNNCRLLQCRLLPSFITIGGTE